MQKNRRVAETSSHNYKNVTYQVVNRDILGKFTNFGGFFVDIKKVTMIWRQHTQALSPPLCLIGLKHQELKYWWNVEVTTLNSSG